MQIVELLLSKAQPIKVGEVSLIDGTKSMCINIDGYFGGGQGPVWATEGTKIVFTTHNYCSLMEGICTKVYPDCLNVTIELTKANTWVNMSQGRKYGCTFRPSTDITLLPETQKYYWNHPEDTQPKFLIRKLF